MHQQFGQTFGQKMIWVRNYTKTQRIDLHAHQFCWFLKARDNIYIKTD